ncbi:hypothetical protein DES37_106216 [Mangrovibacter plantisponsor]|uniref:Uncharacterized protein n=1 Tax=Mangrovibacter plantisponsor TaxID=451513 RepID=A0A317Q1V0_9ENTR|nr:hypothetical protein DES37_106216 [Mangrovibacter plantisponsor]
MSMLHYCKFLGDICPSFRTAIVDTFMWLYIISLAGLLAFVMFCFFKHYREVSKRTLDTDRVRHRVKRR